MLRMLSHVLDAGLKCKCLASLDNLFVWPIFFSVTRIFHKNSSEFIPGMTDVQCRDANQEHTRGLERN